MKLVGCLQNLPCYNFAGYVHKTSAQRTKGVANRTLLIGNPDLSFAIVLDDSCSYEYDEISSYSNRSSFIFVCCLKTAGIIVVTIKGG